MELEELRYPIGRFDPRAAVSGEQLRQAVHILTELPASLEAAVQGLDDVQLDTPYRPDGWTVRQVVHHLADSHLNAYVRLRLALTESEPTIRPYEEARWAELPDARILPPQPSLELLRGLHHRWSQLLETLGPADFARPLIHPELGKLAVAQLTALYGWHSRHHVAHITSLKARSGWS